jgi:formylmethanofuran:tetrahydromethanopterin formyltransferase
MVIKVNEGNLKQGLLGLVVALAEVIEEALERQALRRIDSGRLTADEETRLSESLADLDEALDHIKKENDIQDVVKSVIDGLSEVADVFLNPERWEKELKNHERQ